MFIYKITHKCLQIYLKAVFQALLGLSYAILWPSVSFHRGCLVDQLLAGSCKYTTVLQTMDKLINRYIFFKLAGNNSEKIRFPRLMKEGGRLIVTGKKDANQINELLG